MVCGRDANVTPELRFEAVPTCLRVRADAAIWVSTVSVSGTRNTQMSRRAVGFVVTATSPTGRDHRPLSSDARWSWLGVSIPTK